MRLAGFSKLLNLFNRIRSPWAATKFSVRLLSSFATGLGVQYPTFAFPVLSLLAFTWPFKHKCSPSELAEIATKEMFANAQRSVIAGEFMEADKTLHLLLSHLHDNHVSGLLNKDQYLSQRARVYSEMANVNLMLHHYLEAEQLIKQTIRDCAESGVALDDATVVELSLKLALIYQHLARTEEASVGFNYCVSVQESKLSNCKADQLVNEQALLGMCHNYYSKFLYEVGSLKEALEHAERALDLAVQLYDPDHPNCINLSCDIGVIQLGLKQFDRTRSRLHQASLLTEESLSNASAQRSEELRLCLVHILLQLLALEATAGNVQCTHDLVRRIEYQLSLLSFPQHLERQLGETCKLYGIHR